MRDYLTEKNIRKALLISFVVTVTALPRLALAEVNLVLYLPACLLSMTLAAGAATAWGHYGGLHGLFPGGCRMLVGCVLGLLVAVAIWPVAWQMDVIRVEMLHELGLAHLIAASQPADAAGVMALMLWIAGFETVFFQAATISYLARLFKDWRVALLGAGLLRGWVFYLQIGSPVFDNPANGLALAILGDALIAGFLYVKAGLPASAIYGAVLTSRHFFL